VAVGKIRMAKAAGEQLPPGWARDKNGAPTTDPDAALEGLVEPIGGHKGYALVFMIDVLCAVLTGARGGPDVSGLFALDRPAGVGHLFLALNIEHFTDREAFADRLDVLVDLIRSSGRAPGVDVIHLPGDLERLSHERRLIEGIPLSAAVRADLAGIAEELGVNRPAWLAQGEMEGQA
jgi:LDH2 family malate/lactate/ureidoglycolate dehydrogenase